jgi:hypothetical protein
MYSHLANTFDALLELKDAGAVTVTNTAGTVNSVARVLDIGDAFFDGTLNVAVSAVKVSAADEVYTVVLQASDSPTFASGVVNVATAVFGKATPAGIGADSVAGDQVSIPVNGSLNGRTTGRYLRIMTRVAGTSPSINFKAWITRNPM